MRPLKVSELARRAGVSVRTLHYYEEVGLIAPARTESGHRRYGRAAIERLQQIRSLQQLGFSLSQIHALFGGRFGDAVDHNALWVLFIAPVLIVLYVWWAAAALV